MAIFMLQYKKGQGFFDIQYMDPNTGLACEESGYGSRSLVYQGFGTRSKRHFDPDSALSLPRLRIKQKLHRVPVLDPDLPLMLLGI